MISFFSLHFQKAWLNPCNIRYKNTEGLMGKQNRLLTWNPLLIKANKRHILDSSRLCGWWQIVMLTMVIMSPATYIFHSWQFSQTTHAFIFHYETPLCNNLAITEYHTRSNTFLMVRQVYMCSQDARNLLKCTLSGAFYLYCSVFGLRQIEGVKDQISNSSQWPSDHCTAALPPEPQQPSAPCVWSCSAEALLQCNTDTLWNMWSVFFSLNMHLHTSSSKVDMHNWKRSKPV